MKNQSVGRSPCRSSDAALASVVVPGGGKGGGLIGDLRSEIVSETGSDTQTRWVGGFNEKGSLNSPAGTLFGNI